MLDPTLRQFLNYKSIHYKQITGELTALKLLQDNSAVKLKDNQVLPSLF